MFQSDDDAPRNEACNPTLGGKHCSRRQVLVQCTVGAISSLVGCTRATIRAPVVPEPRSEAARAVEVDRPLLGFQSIPCGSSDTVVVPAGYTASVLMSWGDPISAGPPFKTDASNTWQEQMEQWGMHNDGLAYFPIHGSQHGLIAQNHEYTDEELLFSDGRRNWSLEKTKKSLAAHGVSIVEVQRIEGRWRVVRPSKYARRISGLTPISVAGPAAGDPRLMTRADPSGRNVIGTLNNCAIGTTPWGTFLTCEENFNVYFRKDAPLAEVERRYGANAASYGYAWHTSDPRFHVDSEPNEPNRFGWVVEIDPFQPQAVPSKRTALGRFKHEGACVQEAKDGRVVVYSGDDEQFEYIYRYISRLPWREAFARGVHPLDDGTLSVAQFHPDGQGSWVPLLPSHPQLHGWSLPDTLINARGAADRVGATKLDRPEWITVLPQARTVFAALTNNVRRGTENNPACDASNPRVANVFGQIIRWRYGNDFTDDTFAWDLFALGGDPSNPEHASTVVGDKYGSPDGLYVAPSGRLWIQTDVSSKTIGAGPYAGFGNNQMLCADPWTRETRRFMQGPAGCEITGAMATPDERTLFVGVQHPGESPTGANDPSDPKRYSTWPDGVTGGRPRSSLIAITKDDGGEIGS